jgi:hypothetical protein
MRMMRSSARFQAAIAALAAMLFAQAAFALAACDPMQANSRVQMIASPQPDDAPCHKPAENTGLCLAHCQAGEQTLDKHHVKVPDPSPGAVLVVFAPQAREVVRFSPRAPSPAAGPPPRILFRTLLI